MSASPAAATVLIASYLEPELVERIRLVDTRLEVLYAPELLAPPRYPADHKGQDFVRSLAQEAAWRALLARADVLFDFDRTNARDLPQLAPQVQWVQATSAGIGEYVRAMGYTTSMPHTVLTTAAGVHAQPLAEFCFMVLFAFHKRLLQTIEEQRRKHWERFAGTDLHGQTLVIVGVGRVGTEVARMGQAFGMRVVGVKRSPSDAAPADFHLDTLYGPGDLHRALAEAQNLVLIAPHTADTEGMIGAPELALLPAGAVFINIGRGALVDEPALIAALQSGRMLGAGLDVFREEPLPPTSPLWTMANVIVSPHSASTSVRENARITDLFCANLRLFLDGRPLMNQFDAVLGF
ncbi:MAG TPA: D-2-hydroxyacid dehydrogenase [Vicinamibacterales bacterium]|nr:D-2-hydroxyacid dehydrogenase [Vicinamibacterales bacterium]